MFFRTIEATDNSSGFLPRCYAPDYAEALCASCLSNVIDLLKLLRVPPNCH